MNIQTATAGQIAERMGTEATNEEGAAMRALLIAAGHTETADVPEGEWLDLCKQAAQKVRG
jgi:hypothetical protein